MENLEIIILSSIVTTLFAVFLIATYREFSKMDKEGYTPNPNEKKYGREALFVLAAKLFEDEKVPVKDKKIIHRAVSRTIADMESDGIYFSEEAKDEMKKYREELNCEYSGLPSPKAYDVNHFVKGK
jgi:hypothetical protein